MRNEIPSQNRFGILFGLGFVVVEGVFAQFTQWGQYATDTLLVWRTPFYLIPVWCLIGIGIAIGNQVLERLFTVGLFSRAAIIFVIMFLCALFGEAAGSWLHLWSFTKIDSMLLNVPFWIPLSYACAFSVSPLIYKRSCGGLIQAFLIGCFWQISYWFS